MFSAFHRQAADKISHWTLEEKVGQLFILAFPGKDAQAVRPLIERYNLGGCYLSQDNASNFAEARQLSQALLGMARLPMLLGVDQEGAWSVLMPESTTGPGNLALGSANDLGLTAQMTQVFGEEMRSAGFNCVLGPCADVNLQTDSPIIDSRAFGDVPALVASHVTAAIRGAHQGGIVACAKHFPGHGDTTADTHREIPQVDKSLARLMVEDLVPFQAAIDAGVELIMTSHICYPQIDAVYPATLSKSILQGVLREQLGFKGIVISDSMNMGAIRRNFSPVEAAILAFKAGIDMIMLSEEHYDHNTHYLENQLAMIAAVVTAVQDGALSETEVDKIVTRVVAFKLARLCPMDLYQACDVATNRRIASHAASAAIKVHCDTGTTLPILANLGAHPSHQVFLIRTSPQSAYANLLNPRGIGPNQATPAFDFFADEMRHGMTLKGQTEQLHVLDHASANIWLQALEGETISNIIVLAVMENYPLPGEDFEQENARLLLAALAEKLGEKLLVVSLKNAYQAIPAGVSHLTTYSSRACSAVAAAQYCLRPVM
jgi:beta-N-acetylhexosaminidase